MRYEANTHDDECEYAPFDDEGVHKAHDTMGFR